MDVVRVERDAGAEHAVTETGNAGESSETENEIEQQRRLRYYMAKVDEVSQPDLWEEMQAEYRAENGDGSPPSEA